MGLSLTEDIKSVSEFKKQIRQVFTQLHRTGRPVVITVNGRPDIVLLDATVFERKLSALNLHALLAEGAAEAMVEVDLSPWDAAAPMVLVEEAGGRATDLTGRRAIDSRTFLVTNGLLHDEVLERLRG